MRSFALLIILFAATITGAKCQTPQYLPGTVVVKYSSQKTATNHSAMFESACNAKMSRASRMFTADKRDSKSAELNRIYRIEYQGNENPITIASRLAQSDGIEYAEPYWIPDVFDTPNDPLTIHQYYLPLIKATEIQNITQGDTNIVIGIIDTGVDVYHEDLADNIKLNYSDPINGIDDDGDGFVDNYRGWDMASNDNNPTSTIGTHGTFVAGVACAVNDNGTGIAGVGGKTKFLPIKVADDVNGYMTACYEGIVYAADHGCKIINCSWGSPAKSMLCNEVIKYAQSRSCLIVAAAGNTGNDVKYYPAACDGVICVCGTNQNDEKWSGSTYNHRVDMSAPGEGIYSTAVNNKYQSSSGTSFSTPIVAAAAALVWSVRQDLTPTQVAELLRVTADNTDTIPANIPFAGKMGSGRINILKALSDHTSPSIRITDYQFSTSGDDFVSGCEFKIDIKLCNYLEKAQNVTVTLESPDKSASITNGQWTTESISTLESANCSLSAILSDSLPNNMAIPLRLKFTANGYSAFQTIELDVNPTYRDIEWGRMKTTIADNGKIGIYDYDSQLGCGLIYQKSQNLISDGALMFALDSSMISCAYQTDNQFTPVTERPSVEVVGNTTHIKSTIRPNNIKGIEILQDFIFDSQNLPNAMICKYQIISTRDDSFDNACLGLYFDWDVVNSLTNKIEYDATQRLAYIYNTGDIGIYGGVSLLTNGHATPYAFEISDKGHSINIKDDFTDEQKWLAMNQPRPESTTENIDLAIMLSCSKISVLPHDTTNIAFAVLAAENLYELTQTATTAAKLYGVPEPVDEDTCCIAKPGKNFATIHPTPATSTITINSCCNMSAIKIYSPNGALEATYKSNGKQAIIDVSGLKPGFHIVEITDTNDHTERLRLLKL